MLVADEKKNFVFDDRAAQRKPGSHTVQLRIFFRRGNARILIEEKRRGVKRIGAPVQVRAAVNAVGSRSGAQVNMRAARGTLLRVIHGRVHSKFLNGLRRGAWQRLANGKIHRRGALDYCRSELCRAADSRVIHNPCGSHLARALAVEQIFGVHAIQEKTVAGIALAVGPDRLVTQTCVGAGAAG